MEKVASGEFQREFGRYRSVAHREAVLVTSYGRDDVALISAEEYTRLKRYELSAFHVTALPQGVIDELGSVPVPTARR